MHNGFWEGNFLKVRFSWKEHMSSFVTLGDFVYLKNSQGVKSEEKKLKVRECQVRETQITIS